MDDLTEEQRHRNMSHIRSTGNQPETIVRKYLFSKGLRYRKNVKKLPGKPDIVLKKYHAVVFVNGCFWHQHKGCSRATIPATNQEYWIPKLQRNVERDKQNYQNLRNAGWRVFVIWECQLKKKTRSKYLTELYKSIISISL